MAGPDIPPKRLARTGLAVSRSIFMPGPREFMRVRASAPPLSAAWAISTISVTLGVNLTITGDLTDFLTAFTIWVVKSGSWPIEAPQPSMAWGQDTFSSRASARLSAWMAIWENSSGDEPYNEAMVGTLPSNFSSSPLKASTPGLESPMAFIIPPLTSTVVGLT